MAENGLVVIDSFPVQRVMVLIPRDVIAAAEGL